MELLLLILILVPFVVVKSDENFGVFKFKDRGQRDFLLNILREYQVATPPWSSMEFDCADLIGQLNQIKFAPVKKPHKVVSRVELQI